MGRTRDAEAELNLPPGFRFHPTDEELVVHYLCRKATCQRLPVPIIAEVDLYKYNPWQLPDKALFGNKEWYFFTPRDRKYPNGSRPNRSAGSGYWKATGADKPVFPHGSSRPLGIKKALVFYNGKAPKGIKTDWIMHEYRLADANRSVKRHGSLRLDDWVLCRLYNKKNNWGTMQMKTEEENFSETIHSNDDTRSDCVRTPESEVEHDALLEMNYNSHYSASMFQQSRGVQQGRSGDGSGIQVTERTKEDSDWFMDLKLDDLQGSIGGLLGGTAAGFDCFSALESPSVKWNQTNMTPFCN